MFNSWLYTKSPVFIQEIIISLRAITRKLLREGPVFNRKLSELMKNQKLSADEIRTLQRKYLDKTIENAVNDTEAYKNLKGVKFEAIPFTEKQDLVNNPLQYVVRSAKGKIKTSTGGTTGTPINLWGNLASINYENAHVWRQLIWAGYKKGGRRAWMRGEIIVPLSESQPPFWRHNYADNMLMLSAYHLKVETCSLYVSALEKFNPVIFQVHPSSILYLARYLKSQNQKYRGALKSIITSSETLSSEDKDFVEHIFQCKVYDWYGLTERVVAIGTCPKGSKHIVEDYGYLEIKKDQYGNDEIIGTGFNNSVMPILRYRTGDSIVLDDRTCDCGIPFRVVKEIKGRIGDYLYSDTGSKVSVLNNIPRGVVGLIELQLIQNVVNEVEALVVTDDKFTNKSKSELINNVKKYLGHKMMVNVCIVDSIGKTKSGKHRQAICNI